MQPEIEYVDIVTRLRGFGLTEFEIEHALGGPYDHLSEDELRWRLGEREALAHIRARQMASRMVAPRPQVSDGQQQLI